LSSGDGSSSMVLGGEDVARSPSNLSTALLEGLDQNSGLDGHVERARNLGTLEDLSLTTVLNAASHEAWHLNLSELNLLAAPLGEAHVFNEGIKTFHLCLVYLFII
jgi:hypothetical protein